MTSPLDVGLLSTFSNILPLLLVYALLLGILSYSKMFNAALNNLIAIVIALMMLLIPGAMEVIKFMAPWAAVFLVIIMLILMMVKIFGVEESAIRQAFGSNDIVYYIVTIFVILLLAGMGKVYFASGKFLEESRSAEDIIKDGIQGTSDAGEKQFWETFFHPNVLGFILVMLIALFTIVTISGGEST